MMASESLLKELAYKYSHQGFVALPQLIAQRKALFNERNPKNIKSALKYLTEFLEDISINGLNRTSYYYSLQSPLKQS